MTSRAQDTAFAAELGADSWLETAVAWIQKDMSPADVFTTEQLRQWATDNNFVEEE